jgi:hypothetical protein
MDMRDLTIANLDVDMLIDEDLPTVWDAVVLENSLELRTAGYLRDLGYLAWNESMAMVDGKLEIVDGDLFGQAQEFFAKAREVEMRVS